MHILKTNILHLPQDDLHLLRDTLRAGGVVMYPCDTCWALSCSIFSGKGYQKIFEIKQRDEKKAVSIAFSDIQQADQFVTIDDKSRIFLKKYAPERITLLLPIRPEVFPTHMLTPEGYVGARFPKDTLSRRLAASVGPIVTTSANVSGEPPVYSWKEVEQFLDENDIQPDVVVYKKNHAKNAPSTIIDTKTNPWSIVRQGGFILSTITTL